MVDRYAEDPDQLFVYGSLKTGFRLHPIIAGYVETPRQAAAGGLMFKAKSHNSFPYAIFGKGGTIHGELFTIRPETKSSLMRTLDAIEGHPHHYKRRVVKVVADNKEVEYAWVYDAQNVSHVSTPIPSGIWEEE
jgi:gamma-glutamylcyclotransferase (GGCT)/AIG2-like uncharacterized protein YtfP